jgi:hypothetical protein
VTDYIATARYQFDNDVSAGADAATASLNRLGKAATTTEQRLTRTSTSATVLVNRYDTKSKATNDLAKAQAALAAAQEPMRPAVDTGQKTEAQANAAINALNGKVRMAQAAVAATAVGTGAAAAGTANMDESAATRPGTSPTVRPRGEPTHPGATWEPRQRRALAIQGFDLAAFEARQAAELRAEAERWQKEARRFLGGGRSSTSLAREIRLRRLRLAKIE